MGNSNNTNNNANNNANNNTNNNTNENTNNNEINIAKNFIWIDGKVMNEENRKHYRDFFTRRNITCIQTDKIEVGIQLLLSYDYEEVTIIISGDFFPDFYDEIKNKLTNITASM